MTIRRGPPDAGRRGPERERDYGRGRRCRRDRRQAYSTTSRPARRSSGRSTRRPRRSPPIEADESQDAPVIYARGQIAEADPAAPVLAGRIWIGSSHELPARLTSQVDQAWIRLTIRARRAWHPLGSPSPRTVTRTHGEPDRTWSLQHPRPSGGILVQWPTRRWPSAKLVQPRNLKSCKLQDRKREEMRPNLSIAAAIGTRAAIDRLRSDQDQGRYSPRLRTRIADGLGVRTSRCASVELPGHT